MQPFDVNEKSDVWIFDKYCGMLGDDEGREFVLTRINPFFSDVAARISVMDGGADCEYIEVSGRTGKDEVFLFADFKNGIRAWFRETNLSQPVVTRWDGPSASFPF